MTHPYRFRSSSAPPYGSRRSSISSASHSLLTAKRRLVRDRASTYLTYAVCSSLTLALVLLPGFLAFRNTHRWKSFLDPDFDAILGRAPFNEVAAAPSFDNQDCRRIRWTLRRDFAPANAKELVEQALDQFREAAGLTLEFAGYRDDAPLSGDPKDAKHHTELGVLAVGWVSRTEFTFAEAIGYGGFDWTQYSNGQFGWASGYAVLDARYAWDTPGYAHSMTVLVHEIGHALGLEHTGDESSIMFPSSGWNSPTRLSVTDAAAVRDAIRKSLCAGESR